MKSAIDVLKQYAGFRVLIVGDMKELGENSQCCHQQVADYVKQAGLNAVFSFGCESAVISESVLGQHFTDKTQLVCHVKTIIQQQLKQNQSVIVLAKGSRSMKMEDVIYTLKDNFQC